MLNETCRCRCFAIIVRIRYHKIRRQKRKLFDRAEAKSISVSSGYTRLGISLVETTDVMLLRNVYCAPGFSGYSRKNVLLLKHL